jgi:homoserine kinase
LVYAAMQRAFAEMDCDLPGIALHCVNAIPHGRGLGSSSAAIVAGICAARGLVSGGAALLDDEAVLCLAACMEGHPDNVAPALLGGFTVAWSDKERHHATRIGVDPRVSVVVFVPPEAVETRVARGYLPANVTHDDAAANAGRAALLVAALSGAPELLLPATEDLLHQRFRQPAMPSTLALVHELRADGVPAVISGAGPSVLAFTEEPVDAAVRSHAPDGWEVLALPVDHDGARVTVR